MTDLDDRIASVLRERAEGDIDTDRLLSRSRARGRRRQVRRRAATGMALALVGVLGLATMTAPGLPGLPGRLPWTTATPAIVNPVPPRAGGVPGAAQQPELVGTDPQVLHLGVDPAKGRYLGWQVVGDGVETLRIGPPGGRPVTIDVASTAAAVDGLAIDGLSIDAPRGGAFDGKVWQLGSNPGGLVMLWQPAPGVYARAAMPGRDRAALARAVKALKWDEARRCGGPLRLTALPAGARIAGCRVDVSSFPGTMDVVVTLYRGTSDMMSVRLQYNAGITGARSDSNRTIGGRPAYLYPDGMGLELLGLPKAHLIAEFGSPWKGFTEADATTVLAGAQVAKDLTDPETWK
ncbi:hypothetical protein ABZ783_20985 [Micromonospora sp. NPDC047738]|uniref:hypothetical protein n=1 Tax=Micromonospora sp. NPDC047738 TaxID=3155741 RepID=UPI0033EF010B